MQEFDIHVKVGDTVRLLTEPLQIIQVKLLRLTIIKLRWSSLCLEMTPLQK